MDHIIRSRDPNVLKTADIIVDVGATFDVSKNLFDHHQSSFHETFSSQFETRLSSAGLVYKYFGKEIIKSIIDKHAHEIETNLDKDCIKFDDAVIDVLYIKVYKAFIEGIDGIDNGIKQYDTDKEAKYQIGTDLSSRVGAFNPWWNQTQNDEIAMKQFKKAMLCTGETLVDKVLYLALCWLPARGRVEDALKHRFDVDKSGKILRLEYCPWIEHFYEIHEENAIKPLPEYVLFADGKGGWRIRAVPVDVGSFDNIKPLPKKWCGIRDDELSKLCGVDGCVFVHASGFIGGNKTYEGALAMARKAVDYKED